MTRSHSKNATLHLVSTRLVPPQLPQNSIVRERLLNRLITDSHKAGILAVVTAPAGYGKSTLLSQTNRVYREAGWVTAWLNLEENDNDKEEFLRYLLEVIQNLVSHITHSQKITGQKKKDPLSGSDLVSELINTVIHTDQHFTLFLDDYHVIHAKDVHEIIQNLIMHLPANMNLIVGSRSQLPFPMAKLRANNSLISIEIDDLRFSQDEAEHLFQRSNQLDIDASQLEILYQRTGGWPAIMQLAANSFRDTGDRLKFIDNFSGSTGPVSDFLAEEVIDRLPEDFSAFLIRSAITDRLCYPLCKVITGNDEFSRELGVIGSERFLIQQLDSQGYWYRFHPLFRNYLLKLIDSKIPHEKSELHRRASTWFEEQGMIAEATRHAISGGDKDHALTLLEEQGMHFVNHGHLSLLLSLIRRLPGNLLRGSMEVLIQLTWIEVLNNHVQQAEDLLKIIKEILIKQDVSNENDWIKVYALDASVYFFKENFVACEKLTSEWLHKAPKSSLLRASLSVIRSYLHLNAYEYEETIEASRWLLEQDDQLGYAYSFSFAAGAHGLAYYYRGLPKFGLANLERSMDWLKNHVSNTSETIAVLKPLLGACYYQIGKLDRSAQLIEEGQDALTTIAVPDHLIALVPIRTRLLHSTEGYQQALDYLLESKLIAEDRNWIRLESCVLHERIRLYIDIGSLDQARAIFDQGVKKLDREITGSTLQALQTREWINMGETRIAIADGDFAWARSNIQNLLQATGSEKRILHRIGLLALLARVNAEAGHVDKARARLKEALLLDEEHSITQLFRDEGNVILETLISMHEECKQKSKSSSENVFLERLKRILEPVDLDAPKSLKARSAEQEKSLQSEYHPLVEALTRRELATMEKVVEGYSNKEISDSLYVSINTVKTHIYSSFSKLGVSRRTQAVRRLKELGIFR